MKNKEKETKFNLSEKIFNPTEVFQLGLSTLDSINCIDVKEFIERLKLEMNLTWENCQIINKLAGDKLV